MNSIKDKVYEYVRMYGPVLPIQIANHLQTNLLMSGALLSELVANKRILFSTTKKGGSPFYYVTGQETKLQNIAVNLSGKEKEAYELIKDKKIIEDTSAGPWQRVALRAIKDFAVPVNVRVGEQEILFWRWYLLDLEETGKLIDNFLKDNLIEVKQEVEPVKEIIKEEKQVEPIQEVTKEEIKEEEELVEELEKKQEIKQKPKPEVHKEARKDIIDIDSYLNKKGINVIDKKIVKKNKEIDFVVNLPSNIGRLDYYVKFKDKKTIGNIDLILAHSEGQQKRLPVLFLTSGKLTKKAKEHLEKNLKGQLIFKSIDE